MQIKIWCICTKMILIPKDLNFTFGFAGVGLRLRNWAWACPSLPWIELDCLPFPRHYDPKGLVLPNRCSNLLLVIIYYYYMLELSH